MKISKVKKGRVCVVTPHVEKIDASVAVEFRSRLAELVEQGENLIALNLKDVEFIDSSGLGALVSVYKRIENAGSIRLFAVQDGVRSIFELTNLDHVFAIHTTEKGALENMT
jgi:anti-sigma B factor antagonist